MNNQGSFLQSTIQNPQTSIHWPSVFQLGFSLLGIAALWGLSFLLLTIGLIQDLFPAASQTSGMPFLLLGASGTFTGLLLVPSAAYALLRLVGHHTSQVLSAPRWVRPTLLIFALPLVLLAGYWVTQQGTLGKLVLPLFHILAVGIPVLWLATLATRNLPLGSPQRAWGVLGSGSVLSPFLILLSELSVLLAVVIGWSMWISSSPSALDELTSLGQRLEQVQQASNSPELLAHILSPYLGNPLVIFSAFAFGAVIVPLIEEALKPLGVWFLAGAHLTPAEGFTAGILCGAGYALAESLILSSNGGEEWVSLVFARIGTGVVHILTSGLSGWALASAWGENRYLRLGLAYLGAVSIHGLWNGLTVLTVVTGLSQQLGLPVDDLLGRAGQLAPYGLVVLAVAGLGALLWANQRLRRSQVRVDSIV